MVDVGFDIVDIGSLFSKKAIPQLSDTKEIIDLIDLSNSDSKLLTIVANKREPENASTFEKISFIGYPFSISESFQINTNKTIKDSVNELDNILSISDKVNKDVVVLLINVFWQPIWRPLEFRYCKFRGRHMEFVNYIDK